MRTLIVALVALAVCASSARAETITVNTNLDPVGAAGCPQLCSIRNALSRAGQTPEADTIVIPGDVYTLSVGELTVTNGVTLQGVGNPTIVAAANNRVLTVASSAVVTISGLTLRDGLLTAGSGGNVMVSSQARATLRRVHVTNGRAPQGGGIAVLGASELTVEQSAITSNTATGTTLTDIGGGIYAQAQTFSTTIAITDSTIAFNSARNGGGIGITTTLAPTLRGVTLTRNEARAGTGGAGVGGIYSQSATPRFQGSIVGGNTSTVNLGGGAAEFPANCSPAADDEGGNVTPDDGDPGDVCGLAGAHGDPRLAAELDASFPPALALLPGSAALDMADCAGRVADQRGVARPQGPACDAGAYEVEVPPPPDPTPTPTPPPSAQPTPTPAPTATPTPPPVAGRSVAARPVRGTVLVKPRGAKRFTRLDPSIIANGAEVDARKGTVELTRSDGGRMTFGDGIFKLSQTRGLTTVTLSEKLSCPKSKRARAAARKVKKRKLFADGKGRFRTRGQYGAATVRGTRWTLTDTCTSTTVQVRQGSVSFRDQVKRKNVVVRAGKRYTARK